MSKISNTPRGKSSHIDRIVGKVTPALRFKGELAFQKIYDLKRYTSEEDLFTVFPRIFPKQNDLDFVYGPAFPKKLSELFSKPALYSSVDPLQEVVWAICRCLQSSEMLREFSKLREEYERSLLLDLKERCYEILNTVEERFGQSIWLLQNKLAAAQFWEGIEETRKIVQGYEEECKDHWIMGSILWFIGKRVEATGVKGYLKGELSKITDNIQIPELNSYLRVKIFELPNIATKDVSATLFFESQTCVIDYYETLISILQAAAKNQTIPEQMISSVEKPLVVLLKRVQDCRIAGIMRGIGFVPNTGITYNENRAELIESYTKGDYATMVEKSDQYLRVFPEDMPIQVMRLRSGLRIGVSLPFQHGVLKEAFESLQKVLNASEDVYAAAFDILTLSERFYGHSWVIYLVDAVRYELREEQAAFPTPELRSVYVNDPYISPFSAVASNGNAKKDIYNDERLKILFPYTRAVYELVTTGKENKSLLVSKARREKYLAKYHLAFGNSAQAVVHFQWLITNTIGIDRLRSAGGAALALIKLSRIKEAVDTIVLAYVENQNAPTVLPIEQVTDAVKGPVDWPDSISVPLLFEIYTRYLNEDKLAQLRYAFEQFQTRNQITEPADLLKLSDTTTKPMLIAYLERVWTPKVMRQTIIYDGTKEIEEARIKVCRLLADLDPQNANNYFDEIKERVKQQEIAKVTTLIEQSKVYVEIDAIRKSLKSKLGDSYARYKSSSQALPPNQDNLLYKTIAEMLAGKNDEKGVSIPLALSKIHSFSRELETESDVQFDALFSEVTNEFLLGSHGLNAYLSTRVRHGTLSNTLRKPVADERLVTSREEGKTTYIRNQFWMAYQEVSSEYHREWEKILNALDVFSSEFDSVIQYIKDELIQIRIIHKLKDFKSEAEIRNALFVYHSSNLERKYVQQYDKTLEGMEEFVNYCVNILWKKTDLNLQNVQKVLNGEIRERLMHPFEELTNLLNGIEAPHVNDLLNAVSRAKTNTQYKLSLVISWFKRSEVYDRQDYAADFPFHIALNMVKNTISTASGWEGAVATTIPDLSLMPGRTLDGMVDVFYVLLENTILRSGLEISYLAVNAEISFSEGIFNAKLSNSIASGINSHEEEIKLERLRESLKSDDSQRRAQGEGKSGLHKVWLTINSPIYKDPKLDFYRTEDSLFVVEISFKLEGAGNEYLNN